MTEFFDISGGDGGVLKKIVKEGSGSVPSAGDEVRAHYTGTLDDGAVFDSSVKRGREFKFTIGVNHVIKGWVSRMLFLFLLFVVFLGIAFCVSSYLFLVACVLLHVMHV